MIIMYVRIWCGAYIARDRENGSRRERPFGGTKFRTSKERLDEYIGRARVTQSMKP
jgi:hypothetical protein